MSVIGMLQQSSFRDSANSTAFIDLPASRTLQEPLLVRAQRGSGSGWPQPEC